jgi:hypothetical protein
MTYHCEICGEPLPDYKPEYCCNGRDCACMGLPVDPPWCDKCWNKIINKEVKKEAT